MEDKLEYCDHKPSTTQNRKKFKKLFLNSKSENKTL